MRTTLDANEVSKWLERLRGKHFDLVLGGQVFGGRYGEAPQSLKAAKLEGNLLVLEFCTTESLHIFAPTDISLEPNGLLVSRAARVEFGWHSYGTEETPQNWNILRYSLTGDLMTLDEIASTTSTSKSWSFSEKYVAKLVGGDA
jgi:hypothetical protein